MIAKILDILIGSLAFLHNSGSKVYGIIVKKDGKHFIRDSEGAFHKIPSAYRIDISLVIDIYA